MQAVREGSRYLVRLDDGDDLFGTLTGWAREEQVRAAAIDFGIGMFSAATLGYWDGARYQPHEIAAPHEVVALHGTIATVDGAPSIHLHAALAGPDHRLVGGHLIRATVRYVQELHVETFPGRAFGRPLRESFGLRILDLEPGTEP